MFITFERFGAHTPRDETEGTRGVWLRLHNNSHWPIGIYTGCTKGATPTPSLVPCHVEALRALPNSASIVPGDIRYNDPHEPRLTAADLRTAKYQGPYENGYWGGCEEWLLPGTSALFSVPNEALAWGTGRSVSVDFEFPWLDPCPNHSTYQPTRSTAHVDVWMHSSKVPWSSTDAGPQPWMPK